MRKIIIGSVFILFLLAGTTIAQMPPNTSGGGQSPSGGGAPIGGSFLILLSLSTGYGIRKAYEIRRKNLEDNK
jgi:hypothetical protein